MNNDNQPKYPSPLDKFKNDHLLYMNPDNKHSSASSVGSAPRFQNRLPNVFRQWPEPPPPPARVRREKKLVSNRKRPGSADPRFHRHLTSELSDKPSLSTQSEIIQKSHVQKETNTLQHNSESTPMACYRRNTQINHVNEWLQSQVSSQPTPDPDKKPDYSVSSIGTMNDVVIVDSKCCQTDKDECLHSRTGDKLKQLKKEFPAKPITQSQVLQVLSEGDDYRENLNLLANDLHKFSDYAKNNFEYAESESSFMSELTEKIITSSGSAPCLDTTSRNSSIPLRARRYSQIDELYERKRRVKPLIERNDSQIYLMSSNPEASGLFWKTLPYTFSWSNLPIWLCMCTCVCGLLAFWTWAVLSFGPAVRACLLRLLGRLYGRPQETFVDRFIVNPVIEGPLYLLGRVAEKILALLVMPVDDR